MKRWSRPRPADARRFILGIEPLDDRSAPAVLALGLGSLSSGLVGGVTGVTEPAVALLTVIAAPIEDVGLTDVLASVTGTTDDLVSVEAAVLGVEAEASVTPAGATSDPVVAVAVAPTSTEATSVETPVLGATVDPVVAPVVTGDAGVPAEGVLGATVDPVIAPATTPDLPRVEIGTEPIADAVVVTPIVLPGGVGVGEGTADDLPVSLPVAGEPAAVTPPASDAPAPSTTGGPDAAGEPVVASAGLGTGASAVTTTAPAESGVPSGPTGFASTLPTAALLGADGTNGFTAATGTTDAPAIPGIAADSVFGGAADLIQNTFGGSVLVVAEAVQADGPADGVAAPTAPPTAAAGVVNAGEAGAPAPAGPAAPLDGFMPFNLDGLLAEIDGLLADVGAPTPWSGEALKVSKWWAYGLAAAAGLYATRRWNGLSKLAARLARKRPAGEVA